MVENLLQHLLTSCRRNKTDISNTDKFILLTLSYFATLNNLLLHAASGSHKAACTQCIIKCSK